MSSVFDGILQRITTPVRDYLRRELALGVTQVTVAQVRQILGQLGGRPTALATNVLDELTREGLVKAVEWSGRDGIVYLSGGWEDAKTE